ncbi:hypothetical protein CTI14_63690, partial [Methylobacterium radiotolerans]
MWTRGLGTGFLSSNAVAPSPARRPCPAPSGTSRGSEVKPTAQVGHEDGAESSMAGMVGGNVDARLGHGVPLLECGGPVAG